MILHPSSERRFGAKTVVDATSKFATKMQSVNKESKVL